MSCSAKSTSSEIPEDERKKMGLSEGLLRFSIGYTGDPDIMWKRFMNCYKSL
jgi:methionine-gamma-lyase